MKHTHMEGIIILVTFIFLAVILNTENQFEKDILIISFTTSMLHIIIDNRRKAFVRNKLQIQWLR